MEPRKENRKAGSGEEEKASFPDVWTEYGGSWTAWIF